MAFFWQDRVSRFSVSPKPGISEGTVKRELAMLKRKLEAVVATFRSALASTPTPEAGDMEVEDMEEPSSFKAPPSPLCTDTVQTMWGERVVSVYINRY